MKRITAKEYKKAKAIIDKYEKQYERTRIEKNKCRKSRDGEHDWVFTSGISGMGSGYQCYKCFKWKNNLF